MTTFIVLGLVNGAIYGLIALGLVLIYKGSRVFNFAQAEFGTVAMYILYLSVQIMDLPYVIGIALGITAGIMFGLATEFFVVRPLSKAPKVIALVGTVGAALLAIGIEFAIARPEPRYLRPILDPERFGGVAIAGFNITPQQIISIVALVIMAAAAAYFFQRTYLGMAILANSQDSTATRITGASASRISLLTWGLAGLAGGIAGVLLGPSVTIVPGYMTTNLLLAAFAAAILGGMTSLVGAFIGGELIGLVEGLSNYAVTQNEGLRVLPEFAVVTVFLVLVLTLMLRPRGLFGAET